MAFLLGIQAIIGGFRWFCLIVPAGTEINGRSPARGMENHSLFLRLIMTYRKFAY